MGFLKNFFRNVFHENAPTQSTSSFDCLSDEELEAHLGVNRYGDFLLADAIRPSYNLEVTPRCGYRHDVYRDEETRSDVPVLMAAVSKERLFETFMELLDPLGGTVDVVLETSHGSMNRTHSELYREHIDMPILQSTLWDFEDLLVNDGCAGIAVLNPSIPQEVQFDEHKLLIVYGNEMSDYERILLDSSIPCCEDLKFITEAEHVHSTTDQFAEQFNELKTALGMDGFR